MSDSEISETWTSRDLPVLRAVVALEVDQGLPLMEWQVGERSGLGEREVHLALGALGAPDAGFLTLFEQAGMSPQWQVNGVLAKARRVVGTWPPEGDEAAERLMATLERLVEQAPRGSEERTRLERLRDALISVGGQVVSGALVAIGTAAAG